MSQFIGKTLELKLRGAGGRKALYYTSILEGCYSYTAVDMRNKVMETNLSVNIICVKKTKRMILVEKSHLL